MKDIKIFLKKKKKNDEKRQRECKNFTEEEKEYGGHYHITHNELLLSRLIRFFLKKLRAIEFT